jgi:hypothetical protein
MTPPDTYRSRLRFRVLKKLNISTREHKFQVAGHEVALSPPLPNQVIADSEWLIFNARGFVNEEEARAFGHKLRAALEVSSAATRLGVDVGRDLATAGLAEHVRQRVAKETGTFIRNNVHGLDVFVDDPNVRILHISGVGTVHANPEPLLGDLATLYATAAQASPNARDAILLLNAALMQPHPVAQIVFAFSGVEMLGQQQAWTDCQTDLLEKLAREAGASSECSAGERNEVAEAIRRSHRFSLRQGVLRLLDTLDLVPLKPVWDKIYAQRSTLVHGLAPRPGADYGDLAFRAVSLCGRILLKAIAADIPSADRHVDTYYSQT